MRWRNEAVRSALVALLGLTLGVGLGGAVVHPLPQSELSLSQVFGNRGSGGLVEIRGLPNLRDVQEVTVSGGGVKTQLPREIAQGRGGPMSVSFIIDPDAEPGTRVVSVVMSDKTTRRVGEFTVNHLVLARMTPGQVFPGFSFRGMIYGAALLAARSIEVEGSGVTITIEKGGTQTALPITVVVAPDAPTGLRMVKVRSDNGMISGFTGFSVERNPTLGAVTDFAGDPTIPRDLGPAVQPGGPWAIPDGTLALAAQVGSVRGLAIHGDSLYVADSSNHRILRVRADSTIETVTGTGVAGFSEGPAKSAMLRDPHQIALDAEGNLYIADTGNHRVRRVSRDGMISTVAGGATAGFEGDGDNAVNSLLNAPRGLTVDRAGVLYVADTGNNRVRKITQDGVISTFAGKTIQRGDIRERDGAMATQAEVPGPVSVAVSPSGDIVIGHSPGALRKVTPQGIITNLDVPRTSSGSDYSGMPLSLTYDDGGDLFIADASAKTVYKLGTNGKVTRVGGEGGPFNARLHNIRGSFTPGFAPMPDGSFSLQAAPQLEGSSYGPSAVAVDASGRLYFTVGKGVKQARFFPVVESLSTPSAMQGSSLTASIEGSALHTAHSVKFSGRGVSATILGKPEGSRATLKIEVSADAEPGPHSFTVITDVTESAPFYGLTITRTSEPARITGVEPFTGAPGKTVKAVLQGVGFDNVTAVSLSGTGVTVTLDGVGTTSSLPITIAVAANAPPGARAFTVTTSAGTSQPFRGFAIVAPAIVALSPVEIARGMSTLIEIRGRNLDDVVSVQVSGAGVTARLLAPESPAPPDISNRKPDVVQGTGRGTNKPEPPADARLVVAVTPGAAIGARTLTLTTRSGSPAVSTSLTVIPDTGVIRTVAGSGREGNSGDGGPAISADLTGPRGLAVDSAGNLYIAGGDAIRKMTPDGKIQTVFKVPASSVRYPLSHIAVDRQSVLYAVDADRRFIYRIRPDGSVTIFRGQRNGSSLPTGLPEVTDLTVNGEMNNAGHIEVDSAGSIFIRDTSDRRVLKITADGSYTVVAGAMGDGPAAGQNAKTLRPVSADAMTIDRDGNLIVADLERILRITKDGTATTLLQYERATLRPTALVMDLNGNLFILVDRGRILRMAPDRTLHVIAGINPNSDVNNGDGGPALAASINSTGRLAVDGKGNLYFTVQNAVRMILGASGL